MDTEEPKVPPLELNVKILESYNQLIYHRTKHWNKPNRFKTEILIHEVKQNQRFQLFLSSLNIDDLEHKLIRFGKDAPLVDSIEGDLVKHLERELPKRFGFSGELRRVGSCEDGSKVGNVDEVDTLYVINTDIETKKQKGNSYKLYIKGHEQKPRDIQKKLADVVENCLEKWTWGTSSLIHGGYASPEFSGVRFNGPAVTVVFIHRGDDIEKKDTLLSLDITAAFSLPIHETFKLIESKIRQKLKKVKIQIDDKLLKSNDVHLVPNVITNTWQVTTAGLEATLFRDLHELAPIKRAYSYLKILNSDWKNANNARGGLFTKLSDVDNDNTKNLSDQILECKENGKSTPANSMRYAHALLPKDVAEKVYECEKSDLSYNNAALKHILLGVCLLEPSLFIEGKDGATFNDTVYSLVVKVIKVLRATTPEEPHVPHALLEEAAINVFSPSKRSVINKIHALLQLALWEECKMVLEKIDIEKYSHVKQFKTVVNGAIDEDPYRPIDIQNLRYPEYMYEMKVDLSISPDRNTMVPHILYMTNALMNTCGGVINVKYGQISPYLMKWLNRLEKICRNNGLNMTTNKLPAAGCRCWISLEKRSGSDEFAQLVEGEISSDPSNSSGRSEVIPEIDIFVKPSSRDVWLNISGQSQINFKVLSNGQVTYVTRKTPTIGRQRDMAREQDELEDISVLASAPVKTSEQATPRSTSTSGVKVSDALKEVNDLSLMEQHTRPWEDYIDDQPTNLNERIKTMSEIINLAKPLSVLPDLDICPANLRRSIMEIASRYENRTGFGVWFDNQTSIFEGLPKTRSQANLLCFTTDDSTFELWPLDGDHVSGFQEFETSRYVKWNLVRTLKRYNMESNTGEACINVAIKCHSESRTYPLCHTALNADVNLCAAFGEVIVKWIKCPTLQKTLLDKLLLSLTLDQCVHLVDFDKHQLNYIQGPPGSGKSVVAYHLCCTCNKLWKSKPTYLCASHALKAILDTKDKCKTHVIDSDQDLREYIPNLKGGGKHCLIVDDVQNIPCSKKNWIRLIKEVGRKQICLYVFADHEYQDLHNHPSVHLAEWMSSIASKHKLSYNSSYLSKVHRNSKKVVSFIGSGFSEMRKDNLAKKLRMLFYRSKRQSPVEDVSSHDSTVARIPCGHNEMGDDVHMVKVENLRLFTESNGLLQHIQSIKNDYELKHIAVMIDSEDAEDYICQTKEMLKRYLKCDTHGSDIFPRTGITVDQLDSFVGVDAPVCLFPILRRHHPIRHLKNAKYLAFIASRSIFRLVILTEGLGKNITSRFQLDHQKVVAQRC